MTNQTTALINWLNGFLTTYQEPVSDTATLPYISLDTQVARNYTTVIQGLTIWTRSENSYADAYHYADLIESTIGEDGVIVNGTNCKLWIKKGDPFCQNLNDDDRTIRAVYINLEIHFY